MDPWATSVDFMDDLTSIMRNSILCAIGRVMQTRSNEKNALQTFNHQSKRLQDHVLPKKPRKIILLAHQLAKQGNLVSNPKGINERFSVN